MQLLEPTVSVARVHISVDVSSFNTETNVDESVQINVWK